ncbi:unnamed protein product [Oikopleura dioica]|uniref:Uncharacterized protein n=1 Tax=Oikopleura dioica TaxID=34765 RepID=E4XEC7_OIKDI|nr:unnamed protein product [Oikopleura dioica]
MKTPMEKMNRLKWLTPALYLPHGLSGVICLVLGLVLTLCSIMGNFSLIKSSVLYVFIASAVVNAISGIVLTRSTAALVKICYQLGALLQLAFAYLCFRLRPDELLVPIPVQYRSLVETAFKFTDTGMFATLMICNGLLFWAGWVNMRGDNKLNKWWFILAVCGTSFLVLIISAFPFQLWQGGSEWIDCVQTLYPAQRLSFTSFVYVPTTWMFSMMFFGISLMKRKIITPTFFALIFGAGNLFIFLLVILMQEVHLPNIATQKTILPCPLPEPDSTLGRVVDFFDTSATLQNLFEKL